MKISEICGVVSHMKTLGKGFEELGHTVDFVTLSSIPRIIIILLIYLPNKCIGRFSPQMRDMWHFASIKYLIAIILLFKQFFGHYDVIIPQDGYVCSSSRLLKSLFKVPIILTVHSYVLDVLSGDHFRKGSIFEKWFISVDRDSYEIADRIIAVDTRIKNYILDNYKINPNKISVFINFIDTDEFKKLDNKLKLLNMFNIPKNKKIILCPRRLVMKNGVLFAAESIKYIKETIKEDFVMIFTGEEGDLAEELKRIIERDAVINHAIFLKTVIHEQMKYLYNISDVVIIPSINYKGLEEATSISALEAMACGIPVIASDIGGLKEIINNNETGYLIPQGDPTILADKICEVFSKDQCHIIINARKYVENHCSYIQRACDYVKIINFVST